MSLRPRIGKHPLAYSTPRNYQHRFPETLVQRTIEHLRTARTRAFLRLSRLCEHIIYRARRVPPRPLHVHTRARAFTSVCMYTCTQVHTGNLLPRNFYGSFRLVYQN